MTTDAKAFAALVRGFDRGRISIAVLVCSTVTGATLCLAELTGLDGLCITALDEAVFIAAVSLCTACLVLGHALRRGAALRPPRGSPFRWSLLVGCCSCLILVLYFPMSPISALAVVMYLSLPLALHIPFPRNLVLSLAASAAMAVLRLGILSPETLGQRSASFRDGLLFAVLPLAASALASFLSAFRSEADRLGEALLEVTRLNLSYQDYSASIEEKSALEERLRLTRDIHDVVGYALTNTIMMMRAASLMCEREPERVPAFLESARADADKALGQVRAMLGDIRRREIRSAAGPASIARAVRSFKAATGVEVDLDYGNFDWSSFGGAQSGEEAALATSHFVQEGMLNAVSHGKARSIRVAFREAEGFLTVSVKDDGGGAKQVQEGIGIAGMRERLAKLGGSIEYGSSNSGFSIEMRLPEASA